MRANVASVFAKAHRAGRRALTHCALRANLQPVHCKEAPLSIPQVGSQAPDFEILSDAGLPVRLSALRGSAVVVYFYPKDSTPGCTIESCDFRDNHARLAGHGAVILGISGDSVASHVKFKAKFSLPFALLADPEHKAIDAFGAWREKTLYGKTALGIVRSTFIIDKNGKIAAAWPKVSVKGHVDEVLAAIAAL